MNLLFVFNFACHWFVAPRSARFVGCVIWQALLPQHLLRPWIGVIAIADVSSFSYFFFFFPILYVAVAFTKWWIQVLEWFWWMIICFTRYFVAARDVNSFARGPKICMQICHWANAIKLYYLVEQVRVSIVNTRIAYCLAVITKNNCFVMQNGLCWCHLLWCCPDIGKNYIYAVDLVSWLVVL